METHPREGAVKEEKFPHNRKPCHRHVYEEFWNLRGQHHWEEKQTKKPTEYAPNHNCQQRSGPDTFVHYQQVGNGQ